MAKCTCYYYLAESGRSPVREFVDSLDFKSQRKFFFIKELLEEFGYKLPFPHAKYIGSDIFELRFRGREGNIRVLFFFYLRDKAIFTNGFIKKSAKTPKNELEIAIERKIKYLNRYEGDDTK
ncbi:MAG: type II toxin-antitoxin system RelE/ParE family toxin [Candidatus Omnitrophota bacterium]